MKLKKKLVDQHRNLFKVPGSISDAVVMARIVTFVILMLVPGFGIGRLLGFLESNG